MDCTDPTTGSAVCCTADCQVIGAGGPGSWELVDETDPNGGVRFTAKGAAASDSDPFWCDFNPATKAQYERQISYEFYCDPAANEPRVQTLRMGARNDCAFTAKIFTAAACKSTGGPCVHGSIVNGDCMCDVSWTGAHCNTTAVSCSNDELCTACSECCHGYSASTCEACVAAECDHPAPAVCTGSSDTCTAPCPECCKSYLEGHQSDCDACINSVCDSGEARSM